MSDTDKPFFIAQNQSFSSASPQDDLLHPESFRAIKADSATETQYFGFSVPEERIHALCYLWHHPNLRVVTGGLFVWRGVKRYMPGAEICDVRAFMSDRVLAKELHEYRLDNGYGVRIVEPLKKHHLTYHDAARDNAVDLHYEALSAPVMFADGNHFEQPMRVRGSLTLRGTRYAVDCFNVRDRSWGKPRPEDNLPLAPISWMTGVFNDQFAFNCNVFDQHEENPEIKGRFEIPREKTLNGGWILRGGELRRIVAARKRVEREAGSHLPLAVELALTDDRDQVTEMRGRLQAACSWQVWPNAMFPVCQMRWECEGLTAIGDCQEAYWHDYLAGAGMPAPR
jgi:hypothetical protein